ncbi:Mov34/MPN/PAD-1 family protein [Exiguobacterium sp. s192]|uniref:Mov34/MPN/PAD-1 family protein n=1 Tax=Exiguobacterium sp. s192 TaxID=2751206 RepID=UPI001BE64B01|nr:Mov34/MPN/PAD-1 family protein [Exiguobacterium sp. s192]
MDKLIFKDEKKMFEISVSQDLINQLYKICESSLPNESGGILIGNYTKDCNLAVICQALPQPPDSRSGTTWFFRGIEDVKNKLDLLWEEKRQFYIGEWHYHPNNSSELSHQDIKQMISISNEESYKCPEPILMIIGGNSFFWENSFYIFPKGKEYIRLKNEVKM